MTTPLHVKTLCAKSNWKVVFNISTLEKHKYCATRLLRQRLKHCHINRLVCRATVNGNVERLQKEALRTLCNDHESTFEFLLAKNEGTNINSKNLRALMIEISGVGMGAQRTQPPSYLFSMGGGLYLPSYCQQTLIFQSFLTRLKWQRNYDKAIVEDNLVASSQSIRHVRAEGMGHYPQMKNCAWFCPPRNLTWRFI